MVIKDKVLNMLAKADGNYVSGEDLARSLGVSRNAIWKAINALRGQGVFIHAATNKGYRLGGKADILSEELIRNYLEDEDGRFFIDVRREVASTNTVLKQMAETGAPEGTVLIAQKQTGGKGRLQRRFFSPPGTGIYMSVLLRPCILAADCLFITTASAVAVAEAIKDVCGKDARIKWVNDVYCDGKKVCGILTEASLDLESGGVAYAVLGIGINVYRPQEGYPEEIAGIAGAVLDNANGAGDLRSRMAACVLKRFWAYYSELNKRRFLDKYKELSMIVGREVYVLRKNASHRAFVIGIDDDCCLRVRYSDGSEELLSSGEVSINPNVAGEV